MGLLLRYRVSRQSLVNVCLIWNEITLCPEAGPVALGHDVSNGSMGQAVAMKTTAQAATAEYYFGEKVKAVCDQLISLQVHRL